MSMPANKSDGPKVGGNLKKSGHPDTKYNAQFMDPMTTAGQPSCREEIRGSMKQKKK